MAGEIPRVDPPGVVGAQERSSHSLGATARPCGVWYNTVPEEAAGGPAVALEK
ncbi:MAG TPA: hypothetical protein VNL77_00070 [Roseiflexaceae bacterium]|nr:hypothetical protein [Roseiflexaceae bacterium]